MVILIKTEIVNKYFPLTFLSYDLKSLFAGKIKSVKDVLKLMKNEQFANSDLGAFIQYALDIGLHKMGEGTHAKFLSAGFGNLGDGKWLFKPGYVENGKYHKFDQKHISEDLNYAFYETGNEWKHPSEGLTKPVPRKEGAYSWIKAPRYFGHAVEAGPLARQVVDGNPLVLDLAKHFGVNTFTRTMARIYEIVAVLAQLPKWVDELDLTKPFYSPFQDIKDGQGKGIVEAPRGIVGHWINVKDGLVHKYQIITPTTWNCSPIDSKKQHSACELALMGVQLADKNSILEAGHIVRGFDPCISCSIHAIGKKNSIIKIEPTR